MAKGFTPGSRVSRLTARIGWHLLSAMAGALAAAAANAHGFSAVHDEHSTVVMVAIGLSLGALAVASHAIARLVAERDRTIASLRSAEETFRTIAEHAPVAMYRGDDAGNLTYVNAKVGQLTGLSEEELLATGWTSVTSLEERERQFAASVVALSEGRDHVAAIRLTRPDGSQRMAEFHTTMLRNDDGRVAGFIGIAIDQTAQREAEARARAADEQRRFLVSQMPATVVTIDTDLCITSIAGEAIRLAGIDPERLIGLPLAGAGGTPGAAAAQEYHRRVIAGETVSWTADWFGHEHLIHMEPLYDETGNIVGGIGAAQNVSDLRRAEAAQRDSEELFRSLAETAPIGMYRLDRQGHMLWANARWLEMMGVCFDQVRGAAWQELIHPDDRAAKLAEWASAMVAGHTHAGESRMVRSDGSVVLLSAIAQPLLDAKGYVTGVVGTAMDVTAQRAAEQALRESQERFALAVEGAGEGIWDWDIATGQVYYAPRIFEMLGYEPGGLRGDFDEFAEHLHPEDREPTMIAIQAHLNERKPYSTEFRMRTKAGSYRWVRASGQATWDDAGLPRRMAGSLADLDDRKRAEIALAESEANLRSAQEIARLGSYDLWLDDCRPAIWSAQLQRIFGVEPGTESTTTLQDFIEVLVVPEDRPRAAAEAARVLATGADFDFEVRVRRTDGEIRWIHDVGRAERGPDGQVVRLTGTMQDITERKLAAEALARNEAMLRRAQEIAALGMFEIALGANGEPDYFSPEARTIFGLDADGPTSSGAEFMLSITHPDDRERVLAVAPVDLAPGSRVATEHRIIRPDGAERVVRTIIEPIHGPEGSVKRFVGVVKDITEATRAAEANAQLAAIVRAANDAFIATNARGVIVGWSGSAERMFGYTAEQVMGRRSDFLVPLDRRHEIEWVRNVLLSGESVNQFETRRLHADGRLLDVLVSVTFMRDPHGAIIGAAIITSDVTESKRLREQLWQSQKMEAIGTLAGGIAHDFNNLLWVIQGNTERAMRKLPPESPLHGILDDALVASRRGKEMIEQLLAFSRRRDVERTPVCVAAVATETLKLLRSTFPKDIERRITIEAEARNRLVLGAPAQLQQVLLNLCGNARDAIGDAGVLSIRVSVAEQRPAWVATVPSEATPWVIIEVADTGPGIDASQLGRVFEPFFTTKPVGKGTGLGLSTVHGIVTSLGGGVQVESTPGHGATFRIALPTVEGEVAPQVEPPAPRATPTAPANGRAVLVVDDDAAVRLTLRGMLEDLGHPVVAVEDARAAIAMVRATPARFGLVISDQAMAGLCGTELVERLRVIAPGLPAILVSGGGNPLGNSEHADRPVPFLPKPVTFDDLARTVREHLPVDLGVNI